ncbi:hypothetical protein ACHAWF_018149 [Thalassiosira exigua]
MAAIAAGTKDPTPPTTPNTVARLPREHLTVAVLGGVDAGVATLLKTFLRLTGSKDLPAVEKCDAEASKCHAASWIPLFIGDDRGDVGRVEFETERRRCSLLFASTYVDYVPNMLRGAGHADVAILVVSARPRDLEFELESGGHTGLYGKVPTMTRSCALLAWALGVSRLVVAINKMDHPTVDWSEGCFDKCLKGMKRLLRRCRFRTSEVSFVPISGLDGTNVSAAVDSTRCPWRRDRPSLLDVLDALETRRDAGAPLRVLALVGRDDDEDGEATVIVGKVESGTLRLGAEVSIVPSVRSCTIDQIRPLDGVWDLFPDARPGEVVRVRVVASGPVDVPRGSVLCAEPPCRSSDRFICDLRVVDLPDGAGSLAEGFRGTFHARNVEVGATMTRIFEAKDRSGNVTNGAKSLDMDTTGVCIVSLERAVACERHQDCPYMGNFVLRVDWRVCALGRVRKLPPDQD